MEKYIDLTQPGADYDIRVHLADGWTVKHSGLTLAILEKIFPEELEWYNFETRFRSLRDAMREYLQEHGIYYELSGGAGFWHFEIKTDEYRAFDIERFLDTQIITEVTE